MSARPFAFTAPTHIETQRDVTPFFQELRRADTRLAALVAAEAMQHKTGRPFFSRTKIVRDVQDARQFQTLRFESNFLFHLNSLAFLPVRMFSDLTSVFNDSQGFL